MAAECPVELSPKMFGVRFYPNDKEGGYHEKYKECSDCIGRRYSDVCI